MRRDQIQQNKTQLSSGSPGNDAVKAGIFAVQQAFGAFIETNTLSNNRMVEICSESNINQAIRAVRKNKGSPGIDGMTVDAFGVYWEEHSENIIHQLKNGDYKPQAIKGVKIPKSGGGVRQLGIPTVVDRVIQHAITQVLEPLFDPTFSGSSYGFRPKRSAHHALKAASAYVEDGRMWVVDMDLEKFFDRVNHDVLMSKLAKRVDDKTLLKLIRCFLEAGLMHDGLTEQRVAGTPQGSPLSPLLSNIMLDELDKELEKRGHYFCRYADDCNIYVRSEAAANRVMESTQRFIEKRLKLKVNTSKSTVARVMERKFLGYRLLNNGMLTVAPESLQRFKDKIRALTKRNRSRNFESIIKELIPLIRGWVNYFKLAAMKSILQELDAWIRRKLRCYRLKQRKRCWPIRNWLISLGVNEHEALKLGISSKGWWGLSKTPALHRGMNNEWFNHQGLLSLQELYDQLGKHPTETAVCDNARTVV